MTQLSIIKENQLALAVENNNINLNTRQRKVVSSMDFQPIKDMDMSSSNDESYPNLMRIVIERSAKDLGIVKLDTYQKVRFLDMCKEYHGSLTLRDIKLSFEMLIMGELDAYLPTERGAPKKEHFQNFSAEFGMRVINAYKKMKAKTLHEVNLKLPEVTKTTTEEEKKKVKDEYFESVYRMIRTWYEDSSKIHDFQLNELLYKYLVSAGVCELIGEPTKEESADGLHDYLKFTKSADARSYARDSSSIGNHIPAVMYKIEGRQYRNVIIQALIKDKKNKGESIIKSLKKINQNGE